MHLFFIGNLLTLLSLLLTPSIRTRTASIFIMNLCLSIMPVSAIFLCGIGVGTLQRLSDQGVTLNSNAMISVTAMAVICKQAEVHTIAVIAIQRWVMNYIIKRVCGDLQDKFI